MNESSGYLLDESFLDIDVHFSELLSSKWQNTTDAVDTVCATLVDYFDDYKYLKPKNFERVITMAQVFLIWIIFESNQSWKNYADKTSVVLFNFKEKEIAMCFSALKNYF